MNAPTDIAARLLRFEQQLQAYKKLHSDELAELSRALDECKRELTDSMPIEHSNGADGASGGVFLAQEENDTEI